MTLSAIVPMTGAYDYGEVARSVLIAIAASYAALDLAGRVTAASGRARVVWLSGGAIAMGIGIWSMHFKGMLAFHLPVTVDYDWPTVLVSLVVAVFAAAIALYVVSRQKMDSVQAWTGSLVMGGGIATMHYVGMAAMRLPAVSRFSPTLVTLSIVLAIMFSFIALMVAFDLREETKGTVPRKIGSAVVMGAAISAMHYTGMAAASFLPSAVVPNLSHAVSISPLANNGIVIVTFLVLGTAMLTSSVDRQTQVEIRRLNEELEQRVVERTKQITAAEAKLGESEERFRKLVEALPDTIFVVSEDKIVFINPCGVKLLGAQRSEQLIGKDLFEFVHPGSSASIRSRMRECYQTGRAAPPIEHVLLSLDGSPVTIESAAIPITWQGAPAIGAITRDIRQRKRAEEAVRRSEERFRLAAQAGKMFAYEWDAATDVIVRSAESVQILGIDEAAQVTGRQILDKVHPDDRKRLRIAVADLSAERPHLQVSYRLARPDGKVIWVERNSRAHFDEQGRLLRMVGMIADITERKRSEESLQLFRMLIDQSNDAIEVIDPETLRFIDVNGRACLDLGYTREELLSMDVCEIGPNVNERTYARVMDELRNSGSSLLERLHRRKDGSTFPVEVSIKQVHLDRIYFVAVARDITERKQAEQALRESQAALARVTRIAAMGELTASIAHEINQPLAAVATNASATLHWLAVQPPNLEEARDAVKRAVQETNRASGVIQRIRALLRKEPPQMRPLDGNEVIREVLLLAKSEFLRGGVSVKTEMGADVPSVLGDRIQLQQVILNLIMNGIDAMSTITDRSRELVIKSAKHPEGALIQVQDSGTGLELERTNRIFEPFFTTKPNGIGMGLSISHSIIEAHGGRLWATPGSPHGTVFQFTLPRADGAS